MPALAEQVEPVGRPLHKRKTALGRRLTELRQRLGLSQTQAAARIRVTRTAWAAWERGEYEPSEQSKWLIDLLDQGKV